MLRRVASMSVLLLGTLLAAGCPTPPEQSATPGGGAPPPQGGPTAGGGAPNAGGGPGGGPTPGGNAGGGGGGAAGGPPTGDAAPLTPPSFKDIISGDTITVTVNVKGGTKGQIDFMTMGEGPTALHVENFEGQGPFKITAPASYDQDVYVAAMNYANGSSISPDDPVGTSTGAIKLAGKDVKLTIEIGKSDDWFVPPGNMAPPPGAGTPPTGGGGGGGAGGAGGAPPAGGGDAGGPPPGGDAGGPPPGGDAGAPPPGGDAGAPPPGGDAGGPPPQ